MGSSKQWSNNNQQRNNNQRNNQGQQRRPLPKDAENLTEEEKQMIISYGFEKKGFRFDTELDRGKPSASNTPIVMLDTGNALVPGRCYDHHQLSGNPSVSQVSLAVLESALMWAIWYYNAIPFFDSINCLQLRSTLSGRRKDSCRLYSCSNALCP